MKDIPCGVLARHSFRFATKSDSIAIDLCKFRQGEVLPSPVPVTVSAGIGHCRIE